MQTTIVESSVVTPHFTASSCRCGLDHPGHGRCSVDGKILNVRAFRLSTIAAVEHDFDIASIQRDIDQLVSVASRLDPLYRHTGEPRLEALWRTLTLDTSGVTRPARPEVREAFAHHVAAALIQRCVNVRLTPAKPEAVLESLAPFRRLAETDASGSLPDLDAFERGLREMGRLEDEVAKFDTQKYLTWKEGELRADFHFLHGATKRFNFRRLLSTEHRHIGIGPQSCIPKDQI